MLRHLLLSCSVTLSVGLSPALAQDGHRHATMPRVAAPGSDFDGLMARSMERMHADIAIAPSGDPDRDFAAMMIPHHQGAIEMANAQLLYGRDPTPRRLAQGIIVEQMQEIEIEARVKGKLAYIMERKSLFTLTYFNSHNKHYELGSGLGLARA